MDISKKIHLYFTREQWYNIARVSEKKGDKYYV